MREKILILSEKLDYHGIAVHWGLNKMGEAVHWWERNLFPANQELTIRLNNQDTPETKVTGSHVAIQPSIYKSIWNRRGQMPTIAEGLSEADKYVALNESRMTLSGTLEILEATNPEALLVNKGKLVRPANSKAFQLLTAKKSGFRIPTTIITNSPDELRYFHKNSPDGIVAKMHFPFSWRDKQSKLHTLWTTSVDKEMLKDDRAISDCPMIYQHLLRIKDELRVIVLGQTTVAIIQERTPHKDKELFDVRVENNPTSEFIIPDELKDLCIRFTRKMGLAYSAIDIAVTHDGEFVFLECNESGQFLYLEDRAPEIPLLDIFCQFLASGDPDFIYANSNQDVSLSAFEQTRTSKDFILAHDEHVRNTNNKAPFEVNE